MLSLVSKIFGMACLIIRGRFLWVDVNDWIQRLFRIQTSPMYRLLDSPNGQIRLLDLLPGLPETGIICETRDTYLRTQDAAAFTALSYCWGDPKITTPITFNGCKEFPVTINLAAALRHLRSPTKQLTLWVDALCINQRNNEEKSKQVLLMKDIYSAAKDTCIWLGEAGDESDLAMDIIASLDGDDHASLKNNLDTDALEAIRKLQERPWWSRVWVIQEALLSRDPIVRCGNKLLPVERFINLDDIRRGWHRPTKQWNQDISKHRLIPSNSFSAVLTDFPETQEKIAKGQSTLPGWLSVIDSFKATNPRDKIYGVLGISSPADTAGMVINYDQSVAALYTTTVARLIARYQELFVLHFDNDNKSEDHSLPSWVPDYSNNSDELRPGYSSFLPGGYAASGKDCWGRNKIFVNSQFLNNVFEFRSRGFVVDAIKYVGRFEQLPVYKGNSAEERLANVKQRLETFRKLVVIWEQEFIRAVSNLYQSKEEAFWRTIMADRTMHWDPVPSSSHVYFDAFMGRAEAPPEFVEARPEIAAQDMKRIYVRPFTDSALPRCHGRSFIITSQGYLGIAPFKTEVGDLVCILEGGIVPFVLRNAVGEAGNRLDHCTFIGESYVHGIMDGEAVGQVTEGDVNIITLK